MDTATVAALLGAFIGALAGVAGQVVTALYASRADRRRLALETGFREWEQMNTLAQTSRASVDMYPPVLFVHFNNELLRLIDSKGGLTPEKYRALLKRRDEIEVVIHEDNARR